MTDLTLEGFNLRRKLRDMGLATRTEHWVERVAATNSGVEVTVYDTYRDGYERTTQPQKGVYPKPLGTATEVLDCDTVILCTAREANTELYDGLFSRRDEWAQKGIEVIARSGDCLAPRYLADVIFDGHRIAREFESPDPERPRAIIRERQVWTHEVFPKIGDRVL